MIVFNDTEQQAVEPLLKHFVMTRRIHNESENDKGVSLGISCAIARFIVRDWGDLCDDDKQANDRALDSGDVLTGNDRILARYHTDGKPDDGTQREGDIYIISQMQPDGVDNNVVVTCLMFCDEY